MKKAILFDLDGTLLDTLQSLTNIMNAALEKFGACPVTPDIARLYIGTGPRDFCLGCLPEDKKHLVDTFLQIYRDVQMNYKNTEVQVFPHAIACLKSLKNVGKKIAIITNKSQEAAEIVVAKLLSEIQFDSILGLRDGIEAKPNPAGVFQVLKELGVTADEAVFVGDGDTDYLTGKNANILTYSVLWGYKTKEELEALGAKNFVTTFNELEKKLLQV